MKHIFGDFGNENFDQFKARPDEVFFQLMGFAFLVAAVAGDFATAVSLTKQSNGIQFPTGIMLVHGDAYGGNDHKNS